MTMKDYSWCFIKSIESWTEPGGSVSTWDVSTAVLHVATNGLMAGWLSRSSDWEADHVSSSDSQGAAGENKVRAAQSDVALNSDWMMIWISVCCLKLKWDKIPALKLVSSKIVTMMTTAKLYYQMCDVSHESCWQKQSCILFTSTHLCFKVLFLQTGFLLLFCFSVPVHPDILITSSRLVSSLRLSLGQRCDCSRVTESLLPSIMLLWDALKSWWSTQVTF